jgi:hypothetical protein
MGNTGMVFGGGVFIITPPFVLGNIKMMIEKR